MFTVCLLLCCLSFLQFSLPQFLSWCSQRCVLWLLHSCSSLRIQEGSFPLWRRVSTDAGTLFAVLSPLWRRVSTDAGTLCVVLSPLWRHISTDAGTLCAVLSPLWRRVSTDAGTLCAVLSPLWRRVSTDTGTPCAVLSPLWRHISTDAGTLCAVLSPLWRRVSTDAGTLCAVLSPLWRCISTDAGTLCVVLSPLWRRISTDAGALCAVLHVSILCPELRLPAFCPSRVLCSETSINIWVEPAIESTLFPDTNYIYAFSRRFIQSDSDHTFFFFSIKTRDSRYYRTDIGIGR